MKIESIIKAKLALKAPLTKQEEAYYVLFIATDEEAREWAEQENTNGNV